MVRDKTCASVGVGSHGVTFCHKQIRQVSSPWGSGSKDVSSVQKINETQSKSRLKTNSPDPIHIQQAPSQSTTVRSNDLDTRVSNTAHNRERQKQTQAAVVGTLFCSSSGLRALICSVSLDSELQTPAGPEQETCPPVSAAENCLITLISSLSIQRGSEKWLD